MPAKMPPNGGRRVTRSRSGTNSRAAGRASGATAAAEGCKKSTLLDVGAHQEEQPTRGESSDFVPDAEEPKDVDDDDDEEESVQDEPQQEEEDAEEQAPPPKRRKMAGARRSASGGARRNTLRLAAALCLSIHCAVRGCTNTGAGCCGGHRARGTNTPFAPVCTLTLVRSRQASDRQGGRRQRPAAGRRCRPR